MISRIVFVHIALLTWGLAYPALAQQAPDPAPNSDFSATESTQTDIAIGQTAQSSEDTIARQNPFELGFSLPRFAVDNGDHTTLEAIKAWQEQDYIKARVLAASAGAEGNGQAQMLFAILLEQGKGGPRQPENAVAWYMEAANNGQADAWLSLARLALANSGGLSAGDGRKFLLKAAENNISEAFLALGRVYAAGIGGAPDEQAAERWFRQAIAVGINQGRVALADLLLTQNKDEQALELYKTAVFGGSVEAAYKLGVLQTDPDSPVYDPDQAGKQLQVAADAGNPRAMTAYGIFLAGGNPPLPARAARWFRKAALADEAEGQYLYALSLAKGEGVVMDRELAYEWALRASNNDPSQDEYHKLAELLRLELSPAVRDLIFARAQMPLMIMTKAPAKQLTD